MTSMLSWIAAARAKKRAARVIEKNALLFCADFRRPYAALHGALAALEREADPATRDRLITELTHTLRPTLGQADDLLAQALEVSSNQPLDSEYLEPGALLEQALRRVLKTKSAAGKELGLEVELRSLQTRKVKGDEARLITALACILDNALVHAAPGGRLWLSCEDSEKRDTPFVTIRIGNTGSFIPAEDRRVIFEPFYSQGTKVGLGLAVVRQVVTAHGGWVHVHSSREHGTEFVLTVPAALSPSRYRPLCARIQLGNLAARLTGTVAGAPRYSYA